MCGNVLAVQGSIRLKQSEVIQYMLVVEEIVHIEHELVIPNQIKPQMQECFATGVDSKANTDVRLALRAIPVLEVTLLQSPKLKRTLAVNKPYTRRLFPKRLEIVGIRKSCQ